MFVEIRRHHCRLPEVKLTDSIETTEAVDFRSAASGLIAIPVGSTITELTYYAAVAPGVPPLPLHDAAGSAVVQAVAAGGTYVLPEACFGAGVLAITADAAGAVAVSLKG